MCNYVNDFLIRKFKPVHIIYPKLANIETYLYLINHYKLMGAPICMAFISKKKSEYYFQYEIEPDINLARFAAEFGCSDIYYDQNEKAQNQVNI